MRTLAILGIILALAGVGVAIYMIMRARGSNASSPSPIQALADRLLARRNTNASSRTLGNPLETFTRGDFSDEELARYQSEALDAAGL